MYRRTAPRLLAWTLLVGGALAALPAASSAQEVREREECRCVDPAGNEIENCHCWRTPDVSGILARVLPMRSRARIGITVDPNQSAADDARGARITEVMHEGPAEEAGLRSGDVVVSLNGHSLFQPLDAETEEEFDLDESIPVQRLLAIARALEPGAEVDMEYRRDGDLERTTVTVRDLSGWGELAFSAPRLRGLREGPRVWTDEDEPHVRLRAIGPEGPHVLAFGGDGYFRECPGSGEQHAGNLLLSIGDECLGGVEMVALKPGLAEYFGTEGGVLVSDVNEESPLGLQPGDVILRIGEREVDSPSHARRILRSYDVDEEITLHIMRHNREMSVQGRLGG